MSSIVLDVLGEGEFYDLLFHDLPHLCPSIHPHPPEVPRTSQGPPGLARLLKGFPSYSSAGDLFFSFLLYGSLSLSLFFFLFFVRGNLTVISLKSILNLL